MTEQFVVHEPEIRKPLVLIQPVEARRRAAVSRTQEHLNLKGADPHWPTPIYRNGRRFYLEHEVEEYVARLSAQRTNGKTAS